MRDTRSLRVFNENYPLSRSFSLRVVGVLYPHTPLRGCYTLALLSPPNVHLGYACDEAATSFLVLTALRHSGRSFTAHVAESAEVSMGLCPIPYARVLYPRAPMLFVYSSFKHPFCQGIAPKNLQGKLAKFFAPLTTTENNIINTRAERSPAPRLNCPTLRRGLGGLFSPPKSRWDTAFKQLGTGQNCLIF